MFFSVVDHSPLLHCGSAIERFAGRTYCHPLFISRMIPQISGRTTAYICKASFQGVGYSMLRTARVTVLLSTLELNISLPPRYGTVIGPRLPCAAEAKQNLSKLESLCVNAGKTTGDSRY